MAKAVKMVKVLVISPDGKQEVMSIPRNSLKSMQEMVAGYIEVLQLSKFDVFINEEGLMQKLPPNKTITDFVSRELDKEGRVVMAGKDGILGTAFITGKPDKNGHVTDCPFDSLPT